MKFAVALLGLASCHAQSVKSCGTDGDIFSNAKFTVSPDPIDKSKPLTIYASGTFGVPVVGGSAIVDLHIKALGIIDVPVKVTAPISASPGFAAGDANITVGPFTLPKIPGSAEIVGSVKLADSSGKQILCIELDIDAAAAPDAAVQKPRARTLPEQPEAIVVKNCGAASDHFKNPVVTTAGKAVNLTGTLDEDVAAGAAEVDLDVKVLFFDIPIKMHIPWVATGSFVFPKGNYKFAAGAPVTDKQTLSGLRALSVKIDGNVKVNDAAAEEIGCVQLDGSAPLV